MSSGLTHSLLARLKQQARLQSLDFDLVLSRYAVEDFLRRLAASPWRDQFIVKGAQLFLIWHNDCIRSTRDLDLLGRGDWTQASLIELLRQLCPPDQRPLQWDLDSLQLSPIRDDTLYGGLRAKLIARIANVKIPVQIDVGLGDSLVPAPVSCEWPSLLQDPVGSLLTYAPETVLAEKFHAAVELDLANTRMKDFFDIYWLLSHRSFQQVTLSAALQATFHRRGTPWPQAEPTFLTPLFSKNPEKLRQWQGFLRKTHLPPQDLTVTLDLLRQAFLPILQHPEQVSAWLPGGPWATL